MQKIVLGLSGGVDSAVSAALLKKEYEVHGLYLDIGQPEGRAEAEAAAQALGVPLTVMDIRAELEEKVCAPFAGSYFRKARLPDIAHTRQRRQQSPHHKPGPVIFSDQPHFS